MDVMSVKLASAALYRTTFLFIVILTGLAFIASLLVKETNAAYVEPCIKTKKSA